MGKINDLTNKKFGRLTVIKRGENHIQPSGQIKTTWDCKCDCGTYLYNVLANNLTRGLTLSCGCLHRERSSYFNKKSNKYDLSGDYGIGYTNSGKEFYFDLEDYYKIKDYCWSENGNGYIRNIVNDIYLHRLVMDISEEYEIDHVHGKETRNDNRKSNLRIVTRSQNEMNIGIRENNHSGMTGVFWNKDIQSFESYITKNKKKINLGYYKTFEEAKLARLEAQDRYFGKYSYENSQLM